MHMPGRYFVPDSVMVSEKNGKTVTDTIWHKVKNIEFTNQLGKKVSLDDLKGKILVIDFFFTRCPSYLPRPGQKYEKVAGFIYKRTTALFISFLSV